MANKRKIKRIIAPKIYDAVLTDGTRLQLDYQEALDYAPINIGRHALYKRLKEGRPIDGPFVKRTRGHKPYVRLCTIDMKLLGWPRPFGAELNEMWERRRWNSGGRETSGYSQA